MGGAGCIVFMRMVEVS